ncbi:hypothetical protein LNTAR_10241 [Lentisphaera araneosa HTCC2155]|uniref:Uncharacterized protein n=1 Tax=Lentisphaera araneosa HTCC2155 TaxID=313628 RepID=A6DIK1_9BACT|nr:hypothetical protein [Lentisphaera araneosa]EDM28287.1 hypothetical protein LNTAR_10241 [Lentisphaera araneosa HTCC2155]
MNTFAKLLLIATSLSPLLGAVAINKWATKQAYWQWLVIALLLILICWGLLTYLRTKGPGINTFTIKEFESKDKEMLAFLLTYLLPFISSDKLSFTGEWFTGAYIIGVIFFTLAHANAFHFNPVMGFLGFHFYSVKSDDGLSYLLITKNEVRTPNSNIDTVEIAHNIRIEVEGK